MESSNGFFRGSSGRTTVAGKTGLSIEYCECPWKWSVIVSKLVYLCLFLSLGMWSQATYQWDPCMVYYTYIYHTFTIKIHQMYSYRYIIHEILLVIGMKQSINHLYGFQVSAGRPSIEFPRKNLPKVHQVGWIFSDRSRVKTTPPIGVIYPFITFIFDLFFAHSTHVYGIFTCIYLKQSHHSCRVFIYHKNMDDIG